MTWAASIVLSLTFCGCCTDTSGTHMRGNPPTSQEYHHHFSFAYDDAAHKPDLQITPIVCGLVAAATGATAPTVFFITAPAAVASGVEKMFGAGANVVNSGTQAITGVQAK